MYSVVEILNELEKIGARVSVTDNQLNVEVKEGILEDHLKLLIRDNKEDLIRYISRISAVSEDSIPKADLKSSYPLSSSQYRLWVLSQVEQASIAYNMPFQMTLRGHENIENFAKAIFYTIKRHEILRTVFREDENGEVRQWIIPFEQFNFEINYHDYCNHSNLQEEIRKYIFEDSKTAFDLAKGPLFRIGVLKSPKNNMICFNIHHIISDGWSLHVWVQEIFRYFIALQNGDSVKLVELKTQYKDYAVWQSQLLEKDHLKACENYWINQFKGNIPALSLTKAKKRPAIKTYNGNSINAKISEKVSANLNEYVNKNGGTLFMGIVSTAISLLHKYSGQEDLIVGTPIAGRENHELKDQIGFYLNTLPLRNRICGEDSFDKIFEHVKRSTLGAFKNQAYPFDQLIENLDLAHDKSRSALFDVMIVLQNSGDRSETESLDEVSVHLNEYKSHSSKFDLLFNFEEAGGVLSFLVEYNTDVFSHQFIQGLVKHFKLMVENLLENSSIPIKDIDYLSEQEKEKLVFGFNNTNFDFDEIPVIKYFENQVGKTPDFIAVVFENIEYSYSELNERSNQLAHYIKENQEVGPSCSIGVFLERSVESLITMLAIFKISSCYVPLSIENPDKRNNYIIKDAKLSLLLSNSEVIANHKLETTRVICLNKLSLTDYPKNNLNISVKGNDPSYVIYTSGSTGKPKGVEQTHRMLSNLIQWGVCNSGLEKGLVHLQYASFGFDASLHDIFYVLCSGGTLCIASQEMRTDFQMLNEFVKKKKINVLSFPFAALRSYFSNVGNEELNGHSIKYIISTAEQLYVGDQLKEFLKANPNVELHNHYGPSETHVVTSHSISSKRNNIVGRPPIGKPISNTDIYILDNYQKLVPIEVCGEIYIGGRNLANGYLGLEKETSNKFIEHPFKKGEKIYKSGDIGYWTSTGIIEYLGRNDNQIKIRGHRIELEEIKQSLLSNSNIDDAAVLKIEDDLVAFITSETEQQESKLKANLRETLPIYMIPSLIVQIDELPLNANGKIDTKKLQSFKGLELNRGNRVVEPTKDDEKELFKIWVNILKRKNFGIKDDFFDLGGHSLKATRLISQIFKRFNVKLTLNQVFQFTTIEEQANLIANSDVSKFVRITEAPNKQSYNLSPSQKRLFFLNDLAPESIAYNMNVANFIGISIDKERVQSSLNKLISRHEVFRTSFEKRDGTVKQVIHEKVEFKISHGTCAPGDFESYFKSFVKPFDLSRVPLLRSCIVKVTGVGYFWLLDTHHIISDGTSNQVLMDDFMAFYNQKELPPLKLKYKDFAEWQNDLLEGVELKKQKKYWLERLSGNLPVLNFPADHPRPSVFTFNGSVYEFEIGSELTHKIRKFGSINKGTLQMFLVSILNVTLYKYTGQNDIIIGCSIAGRRHSDLDGIVGMFVNMLAIRNFPNEEISFLDFYKEVVASCIDSYENQDLQFEDLVDLLQVNRDTSRNPIFDVALVVQNYTTSKRDSSSLFGRNEKLKEIKNPELKMPEHNSSKFDMSWFVTENDNDIKVTLEYYSSIYDCSSIERLVKHFINILENVLEDSQQPLSKIKLTKSNEIFNSFYQESSNKPEAHEHELNVIELFSYQIRLKPNHAAVEDSNGSMSYRKLDKQSTQLALFLSSKVANNTRIGVLQERNNDLIVSILAVLKSVGTYVPLDSEFPEERLLFMIEDSRIEILITDKGLIELGNRLQWRSKCLKHLVCVNSNDFYKEKGDRINSLREKKLWDEVGDTATNAISAGGWQSSFTGEFLSDQEMHEYSMNAYLKLKGILHPKMKVLEIGCSSGLTMFQLAPHVLQYFGTDLSSSILSKTKEYAAEKNINNISLRCLPAHKIGNIEEKDFDLVIVNSVIQCFDGHNYLRNVLVNAIKKMNPRGFIFIGDIMDEERRNELIEDLVAFKKDKGYRSKTNWSKELFISRDYFRDLMKDNVGIEDVEFDQKIYTISNELTKYRYDALLKINKECRPKSDSKKKFQYDLTDINSSKKVTKLFAKKPKDPLYIIYTSGSSGKPKGVEVLNSNFTNFANHILKYTSSRNRLSQPFVASPSFDISMFQIFMPILSGGKVRVVKKEEFQDMSKFVDILKVSTVIDTVPAVYQLLINHISESEFSYSFESITHLFIGGDKISDVLLQRLSSLFKKAKIIVTYGPTEGTIFCSEIEYVKGNRGAIIGKPITGADTQIFDDNLNSTPSGIVGEIVIGGKGVSNGYINREELNKKSFVTHLGRKLYKSGDLGRRLKDGNIEFIGRKDNQVKIRGYRIELSEIENVILNNFEVKQVIADIQTSGSNDPEVRVYFQSERSLNITKIKETLLELLPVYMVPNVIIQLDEFPLTKNGKIDRRKLPSPKKIL